MVLRGINNIRLLIFKINLQFNLLSIYFFIIALSLSNSALQLGQSIVLLELT
jgi:hypothetical protein